MVDVTRSYNTIKKEGYILYISLSEKGMVEIFPRTLIERHVSMKMRHFFKSVQAYCKYGVASCPPL
jgi:hypothetical protein